MGDWSYQQAALQEAIVMVGNAACAAFDKQLDVERERLRPFMLLRPAMFPDGNKWCALYGSNLQEGVAGFGDTPAQAATQFDIEWLNCRAVKEPSP